MVTTGVLILVVIVAVFFVVVASALAVQSKAHRRQQRFGLKEARAAEGYIGGNRESARAVLGVVAGVLEYKDTIADDFELLAMTIADKNEKGVMEIKGLEEKILEIQTRIASSRANIAADRAEVVEARSLRDLFAA